MLVLAATGILAAPAAAADRCLSVANVDLWDFLYIRSKPDHRSAKAGAIDPATAAPIVITGACTPPGAPPRRLWCKVDYYVTKDVVKSGYVKMYFTRPAPCPPSLDFYRRK